MMMMIKKMVMTIISQNPVTSNWLIIPFALILWWYVDSVTPACIYGVGAFINDLLTYVCKCYIVRSIDSSIL